MINKLSLMRDEKKKKATMDEEERENWRASRKKNHVQKAGLIFLSFFLQLKSRKAKKK